MPTPTRSSSSASGKQMFQWFLKPRFYSKCHTYAKFIRTRLETIQKKRNSDLRFLKGVIAELLRNGHDCDAYRRAEGLLLEQNTSSCYELIAKFIGCISDNLQELTKQSDCPDECKEAVPSLMYAAARVADLPELRNLRTLFSDKFGNSLETYTSKELVEKLRKDPPPREMKIRLLHDIAQEFSVEWDGKAFEQRLSRHPSLHEERSKLDKPDVDQPDNIVTTEKHTSKAKQTNTMQPQPKKDFNDESLKHQIRTISSSSDEEDGGTSTDSSSVHNRKASSSSLESISEDEVETNKKPNTSSYWHVPPPYLKKRPNKKDENNSKKTSTDFEAQMKKEPNHDTGQNTRNTTKSYARGTSLPSEPTNSVETSKGHARSVSIGNEMKGGEGKVHPNLPDYDDLFARLRTLRGR